MGTFKDAFATIAEGLKDLSSLEVITYKGRIDIKAVDANTKFDDLLKNAKADASFKLIAITKSELDGNMTFFYNQVATAAGIAAHNQVDDDQLKFARNANKVAEG